MSQMKFISIRELQQQGSGIKDILEDDGKIVITCNGKPIGFTVGVDENTFEEILEDWKSVRRLRQLRSYDSKFDEAEKMPVASGNGGIKDEEPWAETEALTFTL